MPWSCPRGPGIHSLLRLRAPALARSLPRVVARGPSPGGVPAGRLAVQQAEHVLQHPQVVLHSFGGRKARLRAWRPSPSCCRDSLGCYCSPGVGCRLWCAPKEYQQSAACLPYGLLVGIEASFVQSPGATGSFHGVATAPTRLN